MYTHTRTYMPRVQGFKEYIGSLLLLKLYPLSVSSPTCPSETKSSRSTPGSQQRAKHWPKLTVVVVVHEGVYRCVQVGAGVIDLGDNAEQIIKTTAVIELGVDEWSVRYNHIRYLGQDIDGAYQNHRLDHLEISGRQGFGR